MSTPSGRSTPIPTMLMAANVLLLLFLAQLSLFHILFTFFHKATQLFVALAQRGLS
jgi:hypothetical protein